MFYLLGSVEFVNALADSGDSLDRNEESLLSDNSDSAILNTEKSILINKTNSTPVLNKVNSSPVSNSTQKIKTLQSFGKFDGSKKKSANTSVLHSLASVACGKGISKKAKLKESKNKDAESQRKEPVSKDVEKSNDSSLCAADKKKDDQESLRLDKSTSKESKVTVKNMSTILVTNKTSASALPVIAPKITSVAGSAINSLFTTNSSFPNQLVIVNPSGINQNSLTSGQNIFTAGQNIVLSLGSVGQSVSPAITTAQSISEGFGDVKAGSVSNSTAAKGESSAKASASNALSKSKSSTTDTHTVSNSNSSSTKSPVVLSSSVNNAPVILSSLPVGSTFMSVNNNLIPIASPSGAFIPTSLPPNIVLTPVGSNPALSKAGSSKSTASSGNIAPATPQNIQPRITATSSIAITVSSVVREPMYTSSVAKHTIKSVTSSSSPVLSASAQKISRSKYVPIAMSESKMSLIKSPITYSRSTKGTSNTGGNKSLSNSAEVDPISPGLNESLADITTVSVSTPKPSARKRISKNIKTKPIVSEIPSSPNSKISPTKAISIASTPDVTITPQLNHKPGTLLFESSGDVFMLEPVENHASLPRITAIGQAIKEKVFFLLLIYVSIVYYVHERECLNRLKHLP